MSLSMKKYISQKGTSIKRGIPFYLTYQEWFSWWLFNGVNKDIPTSKFHKDYLCMCRFNDTGAYELSNIYCATNSDNAKLRNKLYHQNDGKVFVTPYGTFKNARAAAKQLNLHENTVRNRRRQHPKEWYYKYT